MCELYKVTVIKLRKQINKNHTKVETREIENFLFTSFLSHVYHICVFYKITKPLYIG